MTFLLRVGKNLDPALADPGREIDVDLASVVLSSRHKGVLGQASGSSD